MSDVDLFGRDSDTTTTDDDGEDGIDSGGPLTVQTAVEAVESPPPTTLGRARCPTTTWTQTPAYSYY